MPAPKKSPSKPLPPAKSVAKPAAKKPGTALAIWEQEMEAAAIAQGAAEVISNSFKSISLRSGILSVDDNAVPDNELRVIVLSSCFENQLYEGDYDPNNPASPVCYAFAKNEDDLKPFPEAESPQHEACEGCAHNEWGSAEKGKGKACKNVRRLLCITEDGLENAEALRDSEARLLKLPVMSVKNWALYMKNTLAEDLRKPSWGVITLIKVVPDPKSQFKVQFSFEEKIDFSAEEGLYDAMKKRVKAADEAIMTGYPKFEEQEKPAKPARKVVPISKGAAPKGPVAPRKGKY